MFSMLLMGAIMLFITQDLQLVGGLSPFIQQRQRTPTFRKHSRMSAVRRSGTSSAGR
jgi:hypothetical protein